jgi:hypothetical protein
MMFGISLGIVVESSVAVLLAVTIGYCVMLNKRLVALQGDREALAKMIGDLMQATGLAQNAVQELKSAGGEVEGQLDGRLEEATALEAKLAAQLATGTQLVEKIARITSAAKSPLATEAGLDPVPVTPAKPALALEPQSRLHSALQQLAMRASAAGKAA